MSGHAGDVLSGFVVRCLVLKSIAGLAGLGRFGNDRYCSVVQCLVWYGAV